MIACSNQHTSNNPRFNSWNIHLSRMHFVNEHSQRTQLTQHTNAASAIRSISPSPNETALRSDRAASVRQSGIIDLPLTSHALARSLIVKRMVRQINQRTTHTRRQALRSATLHLSRCHEHASTTYGGQQFGPLVPLFEQHEPFQLDILVNMSQCLWFFSYGPRFSLSNSSVSIGRLNMNWRSVLVDISDNDL